MKKIEKISLEKRLENTFTENPDFLNVFEMYLEDFFEVVTELADNKVFSESYYQEITEYFKFKDVPLIMATVIRNAETLPDEERDKVLYKTLIEPFLMMKEV